MRNIFNGCDYLVIPPDISEWSTNNVENIKDIFPSSSSYNFESKSLSENINYHKSSVFSSDYSSDTKIYNEINNETYDNYDDLFKNNSEQYNEYYEHFYD